MTFYLLDVQPVVAGRITRCTLRVVLIRENCRNSVALSLQQLPADVSFDRSVSWKKYPHKQSPVSIGQSVFSRTRLNISSVTFRAGLVIEAVSGSILVGPLSHRRWRCFPMIRCGGLPSIVPAVSAAGPRHLLASVDERTLDGGDLAGDGGPIRLEDKLGCEQGRIGSASTSRAPIAGLPSSQDAIRAIASASASF